MKLRRRARKHIRSLEDVVGRDRLSEMPDEVIVHVLSFMPTLVAVRTVLLRRFGNLWTLIHNLRFDTYRFVQNLSKNAPWDGLDFRPFYLFVRNTLLLHKSLSTDKFHLYAKLSDCDNSTKETNDIKLWLRFALDRQAKEIKFSVSSEFERVNSSILPNFISQSLVTLELSYCKIVPQLKVDLGSLNKLLLEYVEMCDEAFEQFLSGCPSLCELSILDPSGMEKLSITAPNIDKLSLQLSWYIIVLAFPNIRSLDLVMNVNYLDFVDISSVRDIYIKYFDDLCCDLELSRLGLILGQFEGTEVFRLSRDAFVPFLLSLQDLPLLQNRWKCVILESWELHESCLLGIYQLMRNSGHLEELIIYTGGGSRSRSRSRSSSDTLLSELSSPCVMSQLRTITFHGYAPSWDCQLQLVEFLLESSPVLDKLTIFPSKYPLIGAEELEFVKRVSNFRRASATARVVFA